MCGEKTDYPASKHYGQSLLASQDKFVLNGGEKFSWLLFVLA